MNRAFSAFVIPLFLLSSAFAQEEKKLSVFSYKEKEIKQGISDFLNKTELFRLEKGLLIATFPLLVAPSPTLTLKVHPEFLSTLVFPKGWRVVKAFSSVPTKNFSYYDNLLLIQPRAQYPKFNAVILLRNDKGEERVQQVVFSILNPYSGEDSKRLFLTVVVAGGNIKSPAEVLEDFRRVYGKLPDRETRFIDGGVVYRIAPSKFGEVEVEGKKYFVWTQVRPL